MPKLGSEFNDVQESTAGGGEIKKVTPGCYMCRVQKVQTEWSTQSGKRNSDEAMCVRVVVDIDEGEHAGEYSREFYDETRDWMHSVFMSWKPSAQGMLKHTFKAFDEANPGFDSRAAFEADRWELFIAKRVRVLFNGRESTNSRGYTNVNARPERFITADDNPKPRVELERGRVYVDWADYEAVNDSGSTSTSAYDDSSIPF